ncbi:zinc metalloprotease [Paracoccus xiamenensis]|uniref:hypothetical protein n=1 Tax=Paracoccus xiamenensis TaxID=2714901 RepID=UPI00140D30D8|nr:hypothetical protein [Paracoccus xiamenensis]NHF72989.1 hypothetical protein [Paracoccus xiamenensis]
MATAQANTPPVQPPATCLSANAPTGTVSATVDCCPLVATFGNPGPMGPPIYGFDALSNRPFDPHERLAALNAGKPDPAAKGAANYWDEPTAAKTLPADRETLDGAVWVSVPLNGETAVMIELVGCSSTANCSYEIVPSTVAAIVDPKPVGEGSMLKIRGLAEGEASLKMMCRGKLVGYFHIWCRKMATIKVGLGGISVRSAKYRNPNDGTRLHVRQVPGLSEYAATLKEHLDKVYRQALISFDVRYLGDFDADAEPPAIRAAAQGLVFDGPDAIFGADGDINDRLRRVLFDNEDLPEWWLKSLRQVGDLARASLGSHGAKSIWVMPQPNKGAAVMGGFAAGLGSDHVFINKIDERAAHIAAHELGHALGLAHPIAALQYNEEQYPERLRAEVAFKNHGAYHPSDPENLMGNRMPDNENLLYRQWKALPRS